MAALVQILLLVLEVMETLLLLFQVKGITEVLVQPIQEVETDLLVAVVPAQQEIHLLLGMITEGPAAQDNLQLYPE